MNADTRGLKHGEFEEISVAFFFSVYNGVGLLLILVCNPPLRVKSCMGIMNLICAYPWKSAAGR